MNSSCPPPYAADRFDRQPGSAVRNVVVVGVGRVVGWTGNFWKVDSGGISIYVVQNNMKIDAPGDGCPGVLTYEYARPDWGVRCFRAIDDPLVRHLLPGR